MSLRYANILKTVLFAASISSFIPLSIPLSILGLIISYWVDKYLLLRRYVVQNQISFKLSKLALNRLALFPLFFSLGNLVTMFLPLSQTT